MAKYSTFKYGDGTKYGVLIAALIELFATCRSFALATVVRPFQLIAARRKLDVTGETRPTSLTAKSRK